MRTLTNLVMLVLASVGVLACCVPSDQHQAVRGHVEKSDREPLPTTRGAAATQTSADVMVSCTGWPSGDIDAFRHIKEITRLYICSEEVPESELRKLEKLGNVATMHLSAPIGDSGLVHIAKMPRLSYVILSDATITDRGLESLAKSAALRGVKLCRCKGVTKAGIEMLRKKGVRVFLETE